MQTTPRRCAPLSIAVLVAGCWTASQTLPPAVIPAPSRVLAAGVDSLFVLERDHYDLIVQQRAALRYHCALDGVAARFNSLFGSLPTHAAVVLLSRALPSPALLEDWADFPMAVVAPRIANNRDGDAEDSWRMVWPAVPGVAAQMWLLTASQESAKGDSIASAVSSSWFTVGATNLLAAPREARAMNALMTRQLGGASPLDALFELSARPGVEIALLRSATTSNASSRLTARCARLGRMAPCASANPSATAEVHSLLDAQATSVLQYLLERQPDLAPALLRGLARGHTTLEILSAHGLAPNGVAGLDAEWRNWVRAQSTSTHPMKTLPVDPCLVS